LTVIAPLWLARSMGLLARAVAMLSVCLVVAPSFVSAGVTPARKCAAAKLKAAGLTASGLLGCHASAAKRGSAVDRACESKALGQLTSAFTRAEAKGGCASTGDAGDVTATVDAFVGDVASALADGGTADGRRCAAVKLKAAGKKTSTKLACHARAVTKVAVVDPICLGKAEAKFTSAFAGADARYACATEGDADAIETGHVDALVDDVVAGVPATTDKTVVLNGSLAGLQVFPTDNWWNRDVSSATVPMNSDAVIDFIGRDKPLHADFGTTFGIPYIEVEGDQPKLPVTFLYDDESDHGAPGLPLGYPIPEVAQYVPGYVEGGVAGGGTSGDRHILMVDRDHNVLFELYAARFSNGAWSAGSGAIFDLTSNAMRPDGWTSADAAGLAILPGLVRGDEVFDAGVITHALRFTVRGTKGYVFPASHDATSGPGGDARPPLGLRVRLKPSVDPDTFAAPAAVIVRAMQKYGLILADNGSDWFVTGVPDPRWDDELMHDELARITGDDFEVVE
jgi:hypothetical protein